MKFLLNIQCLMIWQYLRNRDTNECFCIRSACFTCKHIMAETFRTSFKWFNILKSCRENQRSATWRQMVIMFRWYKHTQRCHKLYNLSVQLLTQLKGNMEEENRHLAEQNQSLLKENRALLEQSLERRDQHYSQQREYQWVHTHTQTHRT